jgi:uncharacterized protein involved in exopolysaccharide biosynthesis
VKGSTVENVERIEVVEDNVIVVPPVPWTERLLPRWHLLLAAALLGAIGGGTVATLRPAWYAAGAQLTIVPAEDPALQNPDSAVSAAGTLLPTLAVIAQSRPVLEEVAARVDLATAYHLPTVAAAVGALKQHLFLVTERKSMLVVVTVEDRVPARAQAIVAALIDAVSAHVVELWSSLPRHDRLELQARVDEQARTLEAAAEALRRFREESSVVDLPAQMRATVDAGAALAQTVRERRLALHFARGFGGDDSPEVARSRRELAGASRELAALTHGGTAGPLLPIDALPRLEAENQRLERSVELAAARYRQLVDEAARVRDAELRPIARVGVVDPPSKPEHRARPSRSEHAAGGALIALLLAALALVVRPRS